MASFIFFTGLILLLLVGVALLLSSLLWIESLRFPGLLIFGRIEWRYFVE